MIPVCVLNTKKNGLQIMSLAAYASKTKESLVPLAALVEQVVKTIENVV